MQELQVSNLTTCPHGHTRTAQPERCVSQSASKPLDAHINVSMQGRSHQTVAPCLSPSKREGVLQIKARKLDDPGLLFLFFNWHTMYTQQRA